MRKTRVNNVRLPDTTRESVKTGVYLRHHASLYHAGLYEMLRRLESYRMEQALRIVLILQYAPHVRQEDKLFRGESKRYAACGLVGVDVIKPVVRALADRTDHGNYVRIREPPENCRIHRFHATDVPEVRPVTLHCLYDIVLFAAQAERLPSMSVQVRYESPVHFHEHGIHHVHGTRACHPQAIYEPGLYVSFLQPAAYTWSAAVDKHRFHSGIAHEHDIL